MKADSVEGDPSFMLERMVAEVESWDAIRWTARFPFFAGEDHVYVKFAAQGGNVFPWFLGGTETRGQIMFYLEVSP